MSGQFTPTVRSPKRNSRWGIVLLLLVSSVAGISVFAQSKRALKGEVWGYKLVAAYPHDRTAFTQGLVFANGQLLEGTGQKGESSLRRVDLGTGKVEQIAPLNSHYFGEGITVLNDKVYQLTWQNRIGLVYDIDTFDVKKTFQYSGEGWGLTTDGKHLIMSDGSATIRFLDPETFQVARRINVHRRDNKEKIGRLNELEYVNDEIWANVWYEDHIVRISPKDGTVLGWIDLSTLYPRSQRTSNEEVLNGIAYDRQKKRLFVTGKNWPQLFEITVGQK
ncbi:glutaminyl-peptide cyclotransferase [Schlesneria sp. DSM 10557]|uniref:glutaminyl-peptide cyclotransferase n=1 Tax=Schlesneria sp. DSM 10557 TaxID=3044399 RepID=UPI0035A0D5EC